MLRNKKSLISRATSGFVAFSLTAMTVVSPFSTVFSYAKENWAKLSYQQVEKDDVEIYIQSESESFAPGETVSLKIYVQNNTEETLTNATLSFTDKKETICDHEFVLDAADETVINENGNVANITIAPGETFEVELEGTIDESLSLDKKRTVSFFFLAKDSAENAIAKRVEYDFTTGFVTFLPVEFAEDSEFEQGESGSMTFRIALDQTDVFFDVSDSDVEIASDSNSDVATDSDAIIASDSNADVETGSNTIIASDSDSDIASGSDTTEYVKNLTGISYVLKNYGVEFENVQLTEVQAIQTMNGMLEVEATVGFQVAEDAEEGNHFGVASAAVKVGSKTYDVSQAFEYTVVEAKAKLTAEQMAEVERVIAMINKMPEPDEVWSKAEAFINAEDMDGYMAYVQEIANIAWPAYYAYQALNSAQQALVTNYYKLELTAGLWSMMTLEAEEIVTLTGSNLYELLTVDSRRDVTITNPEENDGVIKLTSNHNDPFVWIDLTSELIASKYKYVVVTYSHNMSVASDNFMQLFVVNSSNHTGENETDSKKDSIIDDKNITHYGLFDFSSYTNDITNIRFDFVGGSNSNGFIMNLESISFCSTKEVAQKLANEMTSLETVQGNSAIRFKLFNYSQNINKSGGNWRSITPFFTFRGAEGTEGTTIPNNLEDTNRDNRYDEDGFTVNHATVERNLNYKAGSSVGYPILDLTRNAKGETRDLSSNPAAKNATDADRDMAYLFGGTTDSAVTEYNPKNTILQYDSSKGLYYYDSKNNAIDYIESDNRFYLRNYVESNSSTATYQGNKDSEENIIPYSDFLPFNQTRGLTAGTDGSVSYNIAASDVDYWFGMRMDVDFYQNKNGIFNDDDMVFNFSGDDDVWVFIDDVLSLDLGGTHGVVTGSINFATGEIKQYLNWNGTTASTEGDRCYSTTLYKCFENALEDKFYENYPDSSKTKEEIKEANAEAYTNEVTNKLDKYFTSVTTTDDDGNEKVIYRFKNFTPHKLSFFYMERGSSVANCAIKFNLPTVPEESLRVTKEVVDSGNFIPDETEYTFKVLQADREKLYIDAGEKYTIFENGEEIGEAVVSEDGTFTLKSGQTAQFLNMLDYAYGESTYHVVEVLSNSEKDGDETNWDYKLYYKEVDTSDLDGSYTPSENDDGTYETGTLSGETSEIVVFTNKVAPGDLELTKQVVRLDDETDTSGTFDFEISIPTNLAGSYVCERGRETGTETITFVVDEDRGVAVAEVEELKHNETFKVLGLPAGTEITITETSTDGFDVTWSGDVERTNGSSAIGKVVCKGVLEFVCTNKDIEGDLVITKQVVNTSNPDYVEGTFKFKVVLATGSNADYVEYDCVVTEAGETEGKSGKLGFTLDNGKLYSEITLNHNDTYEIKGLPVGVEVAITELTTDGYLVQWQDGDNDNETNITGVSGDMTSAKGTIRTNNPIVFVCTNTTGTTLPTTGGTGTTPYIMGGLLTIILAAGYLLISEKVLRRKEEKISAR